MNSPKSFLFLKLIGASIIYSRNESYFMIKLKSTHLKIICELKKNQKVFRKYCVNDKIYIMLIHDKMCQIS